jgi:APA family basic amino acid/polyamine antiporter
MINLPWITIIRFTIWMVLGLIIYFVFSRHNSVLAKDK